TLLLMNNGRHSVTLNNARRKSFRIHVIDKVISPSAKFIYKTFPGAFVFHSYAFCQPDGRLIINIDVCLNAMETKSFKSNMKRPFYRFFSITIAPILVVNGMSQKPPLKFISHNCTELNLTKVFVIR